MSVFKDIQIYPNHGSRSATLTWEMADDAEPGDVFVAFSESGIDGSWEVINKTEPVPSTVGMYQDEDLVMNAGTQDGFYKLLLTDTPSDEDYFSMPVQIMGYLTPREWGIVNGMIHQEYTQMRVTNGYPVWHCIPRVHGEESSATDPDTGKSEGEECGETDQDEASFGQPYKGGYYPPVLTWIRVLKHQEALQDDPEEFSTREIDRMAVRMMAFPRPARGHLIVDPRTDRRYLVSDEVKPYRHRGIIAIAYNATLEFLNQKDERYRFDVPAFDVRAHLRQQYWDPSTWGRAMWEQDELEPPLWNATN